MSFVCLGCFNLKSGGGGGGIGGGSDDEIFCNSFIILEMFSRAVAFSTHIWLEEYLSIWLAEPRILSPQLKQAQNFESILFNLVAAWW